MKKAILLSFYFYAFLLVGCGSERSSYNYNPNGNTSNNNGNNNQGSIIEEPIMDCNEFRSTDGEFTGLIQTYFNTSQQPNMDSVRIRLINLPQSFLDDSNTYIQIFRWRVPLATGAAEIDSQPLGFTVEHASARQNVSGIVGTTDRFTFDFFEKVTQQYSLPSDLRQYNLVVPGLSNHQALQIVVRKTVNSNDQVLATSNSLLPPIDANPNAYAANHPELLNSLHPYYSIRSNGWTSIQYYNSGLNFCF